MRLESVMKLLLMVVFIHLSPIVHAQDSLVYRFTGEAVGDAFGMSVSGAGDVDNDGIGDLIIGAPWNDANGNLAGRAYVYSGKDTSLLYMFTGASDHYFLGTTVSGAGDVNNDGYDDIIIGASQATGVSSWGAGMAYVFSGVDGSLLYGLTGEAEDDRFGMYNISGAGDVNNDGFDDVIVGASYNDALGNRTGRAYVFYGGEGPFPITVAASNADMIFTGTVVDGGLGFGVSDVGDLNNDDHDDLFVGAWNPNGTATAYVYSGLDGSVLYSFVGETEGDAFGYSVSDAGDLNNDGLMDFVVGAYRNGAAGHLAGRAYVFYGRSGPFPLTINAADADFIFTGENAGDQFGLRVSGLGDVNNDGHDEVVIGADGYDGCIGRVYVFSGIDGTMLHVLTGEGETEYGQFGISVSDAGDVNNDGLPDLIIGARDDLNSGPGKAYVYSFITAVETTFVHLDIKPGSCPNPLNVGQGRMDDVGSRWGSNMAAGGGGDPAISEVVRGKKAVLPVAILGTAEFDVAQIDATTVVLEGVPVVRWSYEDVATPVADDAEECDCNTDGPDGYVDMTLKFYRAEIIAALGEVYDGDIIPLTIGGQLIDGTPFEGVDCVVILGDNLPVADVGGDDVPSIPGVNNFPNPFNPVTTISFSLPIASRVSLEVYNVMGQRVTTVTDGFYEAGVHACEWDGSAVASGVYFYRIETPEFVETKKMMLLK